MDIITMLFYYIFCATYSNFSFNADFKGNQITDPNDMNH